MRRTVGLVAHAGNGPSAGVFLNQRLKQNGRVDKLRALQYFVAAAEEGSLSGAAERLHVSVAAVSKLVGTLERSLGTVLFDRARRGLSLTADGARYLEGCGRVLETMADADAALGDRMHAVRGTLTVGAPEFVLHSCLAPALPRLRARHPELQLDLRIVSRVTDTQAEAVEVFLLFGWHEAPDYVHKRIAQTAYHVMASPAYWKARGAPQVPDDLRGHECLCFRSPEGTLLDLWEFERDGEVRTVPVSGWLASGHRNVLVEAALGGQGVIRTTGLTSWNYVRSGLLVPALEDWPQRRHAPPVSVLFRPSQRRTARVRAFVEFAGELFTELARANEPPQVGVAAPPRWQGHKLRRASRHPSGGAES